MARKGSKLDPMQTLIDAYKRAMNLYASFDGRTRRRDFWLFVLSFVLMSAAVGIIEGVALLGLTGGALTALFNLAHLVPTLAAASRRLHDTDKSAWLLLLMLIPVLGHLVLIVLYCMRGTPGPNRFGADPKAA